MYSQTCPPPSPICNWLILPFIYRIRSPVSCSMITRHVILVSVVVKPLVFCVVFCGPFFLFFFLWSVIIVCYSIYARLLNTPYDVSYYRVYHEFRLIMFLSSVYTVRVTHRVGDVDPFKPPCVTGGASAINNSVYCSHQLLLLFRSYQTEELGQFINDSHYTDSHNSSVYEHNNNCEFSLMSHVLYLYDGCHY